MILCEYFMFPAEKSLVTYLRKKGFYLPLDEITTIAIRRVLYLSYFSAHRYAHPTPSANHWR